MDEQLTSYCGLCCDDCIPSREEFFLLVHRLEEVLEELQFDRYAELKAKTIEELKDYPTFLSVLRRIRELRCAKPCRQGGGKPACPIRQAAQDKGLPGCWACDIRRQCPQLDRLRGIHPHLDHHLDLINELGPAGWFTEREEHYRWQVRGKDQSA